MVFVTESLQAEYSGLQLLETGAGHRNNVCQLTPKQLETESTLLRPQYCYKVECIRVSLLQKRQVLAPSNRWARIFVSKKVWAGKGKGMLAL